MECDDIMNDEEENNDDLINSIIENDENECNMNIQFNDAEPSYDMTIGENKKVYNSDESFDSFFKASKKRKIEN